MIIRSPNQLRLSVKCAWRFDSDVKPIAEHQQKSRFSRHVKNSWREKLISPLSGTINKEREIIRLDWSIMTMRMKERMKIFHQKNHKERISIELIDVKKIIPRILPVDSTFSRTSYSNHWQPKIELISVSRYHSVVFDAFSFAMS